MNKILDHFMRIPRISLAPLNTPVERLDRLSSLFGGTPGLFIKRDDFIGQLVWGNKLRKLEYTIAHALSEGADTLITCGAVQSNHARTTAQVAKRLGLDCILVLNGAEPDVDSGNFRIVRLMNVEVHFVPGRDQRDPEMHRIAARLKETGRKPFIIPLGASDEFGVPGFANAIAELREQSERMSNYFTHIYHSTSSGGTQGGLEAGKRIFGLENLRITGISADDPSEKIKSRVMECANPFLEKLGFSRPVEKEEITVYDTYAGTGYGIPTPESDEAKRLFLEYEGILLDDTYTAKAAAGLIAHCRKGLFKPADNVIFWHTGGLINLF